MTFDDGYDRCFGFWGCWITTFDFSFKSTGSVGGFLNDPNWDASKINFPRLAWDNLQKFICMEIMINIVAGIIIDEFCDLKDEYT